MFVTCSSPSECISVCVCVCLCVRARTFARVCVVYLCVFARVAHALHFYRFHLRLSACITRRGSNIDKGTEGADAADDAF
jgi:hypothetical protein